MLVSTEWLADRLHDPDVVVVDLRWREDGSGRACYEAGHIPGARFLDWTSDIVDPKAGLAFMLAPPDEFASAMEERGIGDRTTVIAYSDDRGSGPHRLWWASRVYGHENVLVLDGALEKWNAEGRAVSTGGPGRVDPAVWNPEPVPGLVATANDVIAARLDPNAVVLDSRPPEQYRGDAVWFETGPVPADGHGIAHTPRGDLRTGHIPWAESIPSAELYRSDATMKDPAELIELFGRAGVSPSSRVIAYCGVGISAAALLFAATLVGVEEASLYDASWDEWGRDASLPVERS